MNIVAFCSILIAFSLFFTSVSQADITLSISPDTQSVSLGSPVSFAVDISGLGSGTALSAYDVSIGFDPTLLSYTQTNFGDPLLGDQLDLAKSGLNGPSATPSTGSVDLIEFSLDSTATLNAQQAGSFTLATLSFDTLAAGTSALSLTVNSLSDAYGNTIAYSSLNNGSVNIPSAVPLPGGLLLFMSGWSALLLAQRRR